MKRHRKPRYRIHVCTPHASSCFEMRLHQALYWMFQETKPHHMAGVIGLMVGEPIERVSIPAAKKKHRSLDWGTYTPAWNHET